MRTTAEIAEITDAKPTQVAHLVNKGIIVPHRPDNRRGGSHMFSEVNLFEIFCCKYVADFGVPVARLMQIPYMFSKEKPTIDYLLEYPDGDKYFLVMSHPTSYTADGRKLSMKVEGDMPEDVRRTIMASSGESSIKKADELPEFLSKHPSAITINLNGIAREVVRAR